MDNRFMWTHPTHETFLEVLRTDVKNNGCSLTLDLFSSLNVILCFSLSSDSMKSCQFSSTVAPLFLGVFWGKMSRRTARYLKHLCRWGKLTQIQGIRYFCFWWKLKQLFGHPVMSISITGTCRKFPKPHPLVRVACSYSTVLRDPGEKTKSISSFLSQYWRHYAFLLFTDSDVSFRTHQITL